MLLHRKALPFICTFSLITILLYTSSTDALSYAALGDSYAAGDGAGSPRLPPHRDFGCGRFEGAYPLQLSLNFTLQIPPSQFTNVACGGASSTSVLKTQVPRVPVDVDVVTLTVGGNEIDFFAVLNACVHGWFPGWDCDRELVRAREHVISDTFLKNYGMLVKGAKERNHGGRLLITGYTKFFDAETTQCDGVSFAKGQKGRYLLTREMRGRFNAIVDALNNVIRASAQTYGAEYVDIDSLFDGHRFCEAGVEEPSNVNQTWFFNLKYEAREDREMTDQQVLPGPIEDYLEMTRVFHPTASGHEAISRKLAQMILNK
jgi:lysophospholipase L1-like esterase